MSRKGICQFKMDVVWPVSQFGGEFLAQFTQRGARGMTLHIIEDQSIGLQHEIPRLSAKLLDGISSTQYRPVTTHNDFGRGSFDCPDRLKVSIHVKISGTKRPASVDGSITCSLNGVAVVQRLVSAIVNAQMSIAMTGQVPDLHNPVSAKTNNLATY